MVTSFGRGTIVVAVDFGTTFSGVAWAQASRPDKHYVINQWPHDSSSSLDGMTSEKVPSEVSYEYQRTGPKCLWGFQIIDCMPRLQWIKLGLVPDQKLGIESRLSSTYSDRRRAVVPYHSTPEKTVTDYLRSLHEHIVRIIGSKIGNSFDKMALEYVITVPAMWPDRAKAETLSCAENAGFGQASKVRIVSEPESAAMHSLQASNPHGLDVDDTIVICDAGGGTVDLITFSILELTPSLRLKEEAPGVGSLCGSTFLNRRFEEFVEERLSSRPGWGIDTLEEALARFETVAKRSFRGNVNDDFMFPVPGITDNDEIRVRRGRLRVTGHEMIRTFQPVLNDIQHLVSEQIRISRKKAKAVFLVGGFGQNPYLRRYLRENIVPEIEIKSVVDGWTAVVRGALTKALSEIAPLAPKASVESRVARRHYGNIKVVKFVPGLHDERQKYWDYYDGEYKIDVMHWFIRKGDAIKELEPIRTSWFKHQLTKYGRFDSVRFTLFQLDTPSEVDAPMYFNSSMKTHAVLNPALDTILKKRIPTRRGKDNKMYYEVEFAIHAAYFSAHCEYTLWFENKNHGSVKVDYV